MLIRLPTLFAFHFSCHHVFHSPPTKPSFDTVAEMISSIQKLMKALNPAWLQSDEGVQLDFAEAVAEDPFGPGPPDPLRGLGLGMATATAEKDVGTSGLPGGGKMNLSVSLVLLSLQNERDYCCGLIGRDRICLNNSHLCDVAKHEREKFTVNEEVLQIMAPATKATKFAAYRDPSLPISKLNTSQYESLMQERHDVAEWNRILTAVKVVWFEDEEEFEEVKARATKKSDLGMAFTPNKKARRAQEELGLEKELVFVINPTNRVRLSAVPIDSSVQPVTLQGATWSSLIEYISMLDYRLSVLQSVLTGHRDATENRFADVEDELGLVVADMGDGGDVPGGPLTSMWSAVATSLEENRALSRIITALAEQSKQVVGKAQQARQGAAQAAQEVVGVRTSIVSLTAG
jgi:hypothetical protein